MLKYGIMAGVGILIFFAGVLFIEFSGVFEPSHISGHGWFAFGLAACLSILVSVGLFALIFFSARSGHDDINDLNK
ncbi:hypothetical protein [Ponticaulis profundi]|uniref:Uncharacterized protein n=1 Tax=Ponticaulis profundi TaxID=2665222 RepID=A0ABW1S558_9PROT